MNDRSTECEGAPCANWLVCLLLAARRRPRRSAAALVLLAAIALHGIWLRGLGGLLTAERPIDGFDRVWVRTNDFVCDGDGALSVAAALCKQDSARGVLVVDQRPMPCVRAGVVPPQSEAVCRELQRRGLPRERIEILPGQASDLADEAKILQEWMRRRADSKVLLLCGQMAGAGRRYVLDQEMEPEIAARVGILGLPQQGVDPSNWWKSRTGFKAFFTAALDRAFLSLCGASRTPPPPWDYERFEAEMAALAKEGP